jgi:hypothetical protein
MGLWWNLLIVWDRRVVEKKIERRGGVMWLALLEMSKMASLGLSHVSMGLTSTVIGGIYGRKWLA